MLGCSLGPSPQPTVDSPVMLHFKGMDGLVDAVVAGQTETARTVARDMTAGEGPAGEELGSAAVGSALGFLQIAEGEELADGLAALAVACGTCHAEEAVPSPTPEAPSHGSLGRLLVQGAVWNRDVRVDLDGSDVGRALAAPGTAEEKLARALNACRGCHAGDGPPGGVDPAVLKALCADSCSGGVTLYRLADGPVDRLVQFGDLSRCSHVVRRWAGVDGEVVLSASDETKRAEATAAFDEQVAAYMGSRLPAAEVSCPH
jgi:cytochrome c553